MYALKLNALRAFAAVYEAGGMRPAARSLGIAHSAVSRHVSELEEWLGVPLLGGHSGRRTGFTAQGEALGRSALAGLSALAEAVTQVRESRRANSVVIATAASLASRWLLPRLPRLAERAPWVEVSVLVQPRVAGLADQGADLALRMGPGPWPGEAAEPLMDESLFPVMSEQAWLKAGRPHRLGDLLKLPLIHDRDPNAGWALWRDAFGPAALDVQKGARFDFDRSRAPGGRPGHRRRARARPPRRSGARLRQAGPLPRRPRRDAGDGLLDRATRRRRDALRAPRGRRVAEERGIGRWPSRIGAGPVAGSACRFGATPHWPSRYKLLDSADLEACMTRSEDKSAALRLAEEMQRRPLTTAAIVGGAAAAATGAFIGARALARRNGARAGEPVNAVMEAAITACEAAAACKGGEEV